MVNFFDEFREKGKVPESKLTIIDMVGYVDTYQTIMFNGNIYPNIPWEISKEHEEFIEFYRALEFYEIDF